MIFEHTCACTKGLNSKIYKSNEQKSVVVYLCIAYNKDYKEQGEVQVQSPCIQTELGVLMEETPFDHIVK